MGKAIAMAKEKIAAKNEKQKTRKVMNGGISAKLNRAAVTDEERRQLIMKAAYFRAEQRGFTPGAEMDDWLQAEAEIDGAFKKMSAGD